jgi:DNA-binding CsgD family transcriptional regulator/tetratricopeptide (TPR) repeat protein
MRALKGAAILARAQGEYEAAEEYSTAMLALAGEINDRAATADARYWVGFNASALGDGERADRLIQESLTLWRRVGNPWGITWPLGLQVGDALSRGDYTEAIALGQERLRLAREADDPWLIAIVEVQLGVLAYEQDQHDVAIQWLQAAPQGLEQLDDSGSDWASVLYRSGQGARARGERSEALHCLGESLLLHQRLGQMWGAVQCLEDVAGVLSDLKQFEAAVRLAGSAVALRRRLGFRRSGRGVTRQELDMKAARTALGAARLEAVWALGELLIIDAAIDDALAMVSSSSETGASTSSTREGDRDTLTTRELEVATLVASGHSNREIADRLVIALSTAERHGANILGKN